MPLLSLLLLSLSLAMPAHAKPKKTPPRPAMLEKIQEACEERVEENYKNGPEICACVSRNLDSKLGTADLELISRSHQEDPKAEEELQDEKHSALILFDYEVTEACLEKPQWSHRSPMSQLLFLLIVSFPAIALSPLPPQGAGKAAILAELKALCQKNSKAEGKSEDAVCECLGKNYELKFSRAQLQILAEGHKGNTEHLVKHEEIFSFDQEAAEGCVANPAWRFKP